MMDVKLNYYYLCKQSITYPYFRGIRVLPEFDAPAHASAGWQFGPETDQGKLVICDVKEWDDGKTTLAAEPNAGQLNPLNKHVYAVSPEKE